MHVDTKEVPAVPRYNILDFTAEDFDEAYDFYIWVNRSDFGVMVHTVLTQLSISGTKADTMIISESLITYLSSDNLLEFQQTTNGRDVRRGNIGTMKLGNISLNVVCDHCVKQSEKFVPLNGFWVGDGYLLLEAKARMYDFEVSDLAK